MRLAWHIARKDFRRLRWPLALWGVVIGLQYLSWRLMPVGDGEASGAAKLVLALWGLHLAVGWLLVPHLIHEDPLLDDRAAWRTRPISGARLLAAKLLGAALMLWLWPSVLTVPWWIEFGFGPWEIARAVAVNMLGMAAFTGVALMVAVLTENFARFLTWSFLLAVAAGVGGLLIVAEMPALMEMFAYRDGTVNAGVLITRAWLAGGVVLAAAVVVVPMQFVARRAALARSVAAAAALAVALMVWGWPWSAAQMLAMTGWKAFALPTVSARVGEATLVVPPVADKQPARVQVMTLFDLKGLKPGDLPMWGAAEPKWRIGDNRGPDLPVSLNHWASRRAVAVAVARGDTARHDSVEGAAWQITLSGQLVPSLRDGQAAFSARNHGAIWRGVPGPAVPVRAGAGAARGLTQIHVKAIGLPGRYAEDSVKRTLRWVQTAPLFAPTAILELLNQDGMARHRFTAALVTNGQRSFLDELPDDNRWEYRHFLPAGRIPVGLVAVTMRSCSFDQRWGRTEADSSPDAEPIALEGATLTSVTFEEAAPMKVALAETPFMPNLIIEGRLDDALRRAKAEGKLVLARVPGADEKDDPLRTPNRWIWPRLRELLVARFVCVQVGPEEAGRFRRQSSEQDSPLLVVLKAGGEELDRMGDLAPADLVTALNASVEGKTYAAVLRAELAARGGEDRRLRFQLHEALRVRGELVGALEVILWMVDHSDFPTEGSEIFTMGSRLQRFVASYGPAKAILLERRDRAVANLRQDPRDVGAARRLFAITFGLRHDDAAWREFPRVMPRENPLWWEFTRNWVSHTVGDKRYGEAVGAVDLERFFTEGPAWVRAQLLQKRSFTTGGRPVTIAEWQWYLVRTGGNCVEALAGAGRPEAAVRLARATLRINRAAETRMLLAGCLRRGGASVEAEKLLLENSHAP